MKREVDAKADHRHRHDESEHEIVLETEQVADALEPDDQSQKRHTHRRQNPIATKGQSDQNENRQDGQANEWSRHGALFF